MGEIVLTEEPGRHAEKIGGMKRDGRGGAGDEKVAVKGRKRAGSTAETNPTLERSNLPSQLLFR